MAFSDFSIEVVVNLLKNGAKRHDRAFLVVVLLDEVGDGWWVNGDSEHQGRIRRPRAAKFTIDLFRHGGHGHPLKPVFQFKPDQDAQHNKVMAGVFTRHPWRPRLLRVQGKLLEQAAKLVTVVSRHLTNIGGSDFPFSHLSILYADVRVSNTELRIKYADGFSINAVFN